MFLQGGIQFHAFDDKYETRDLSAPPIKYFDSEIGRDSLKLNTFNFNILDVTQNLVDVTYNRYLVGFDRANHKFLTVNSKSSSNSGDGHYTLHYTENGVTSLKSFQHLYGAYLFVGENI